MLLFDSFTEIQGHLLSASAQRVTHLGLETVFIRLASPKQLSPASTFPRRLLCGVQINLGSSDVPQTSRAFCAFRWDERSASV